MELLLSLILAVGASIVAIAVHRTRLDSRMRRAKRVAIAALREDQRARISGTVQQLDAFLTAPLTGRPCVGYRVEARYRIDATKRGRVTISKSNGVPFLLADDTGSVVVEPAGAEVHMWPDVFAAADEFDAERIRAFLDRYPRQAMYRRRLYFYESVIVAGATIDVIGAGNREADPDGAAASYRSTPTRMRLVHAPRSPMWIVKPPT